MKYKARSSIRSQFGDSECENKKISYPENRSNQTYTSRTNQILRFLSTGQVVAGSQGLYDFPDGRDDGSPVPFYRDTRIQAPELYQASLKANEKAGTATQTILNALNGQQTATENAPQPPKSGDSDTQTT